MKKTLFWILAFTLLLSSCNTPSAAPTDTPLSEPAALAPTSTPTEAPPTEPLPPTEIPTQTPEPKEIWLPPLGASFGWQLGDEIDTSASVDIYDLDAFDTEASLVARLHAEGKKVFCYISVGSWEDWRPDKDQFPPEIIGNDYDGWPGEKWLDIRQIDTLAPIMRTRLDICAEKGFDGVEPDNMDLHWADSGFDISYDDQLAYNLWLSEEAHARGLSIGLKNNNDQVEDLLPYFDWALTEDCFVQTWCDALSPFIEAGKPVFAVEYTDEVAYETFLTGICPQAARLGFYALHKNRNLDEYRDQCP